MWKWTRNANFLADAAEGDPQWNAGWLDGSQPGATKNVPMHNGHQYATGYLAALLMREILTPRRR